MSSPSFPSLKFDLNVSTDNLANLHIKRMKRSLEGQPRRRSVRQWINAVLEDAVLRRPAHTNGHPTLLHKLLTYISGGAEPPTFVRIVEGLTNHGDG